MSGKRISAEVKEEILNKIRGGRAVKEVAEEHGVRIKTIYGWLKRGAAGSENLLELSRLRRENEALLKFVGRLTYQAELAKKNWRS